MKDFSRSAYNFATIRTEQKIIYTIFLGFMLLGILSILVFYLAKTGLGATSLVEYYRGNEEKLMYPKTFGELWEVTHFHCFTMPVIFLIFSHLFALTRLPGPIKGIVMVCAAIGMFLDIISGWLIVYVGPAFVYLKILGRLLLATSFPVFLAVPIHEMWFKKHKPRAASHSPRV